MYPTNQSPSQASAHSSPDGSLVVKIGAADVGTGARTALTQIAAEELGVSADEVTVEIGDSGLPYAIGAFASQGTASWGHAVVLACRELRRQLAGLERIPEGGVHADADTTEELARRAEFAHAAFGAQFASVRVHAGTGEVRVDRLLGMYAAGRIVNPRTARSQLIGGMTWGISMALHEESILDPNLGEYVNNDFGGYHVAACADIPDIEVGWIEEEDDHINPIGAKGIGEIGIVGTAAAIANAVFDATGVRIRDLPLRVDHLVR